MHRTSSPLESSNTRSVLSLLPLTMWRPSADHAALGSVGPLRRQLTRLVVRDAVNAYWGGAVLVLLPLVYLWREWPPWAIRDALVQLPVTERAVVMAALHVVYARVTAPVVRRLLASERLRWWWTLPLSAGEGTESLSHHPEEQAFCAWTVRL